MTIETIVTEKKFIAFAESCLNRLTQKFCINNDIGQLGMTSFMRNVELTELSWLCIEAFLFQNVKKKKKS